MRALRLNEHNNTVPEFRRAYSLTLLDRGSTITSMRIPFQRFLQSVIFFLLSPPFCSFPFYQHTPTYMRAHQPTSTWRPTDKGADERAGRQEVGFSSLTEQEGCRAMLFSYATKRAPMRKPTLSRPINTLTGKFQSTHLLSRKCYGHKRKAPRRTIK